MSSEPRCQPLSTYTTSRDQAPRSTTFTTQTLPPTLRYRDIFNMVSAALRAERGSTTAETERNQGRAERAVMGSWVPLALS